MASQLSSNTLRRAQLPTPSLSTISKTQQRHASLLKRPHRPYTFTQLIILSDGSTYTARTTSPLPIFRSTKDTRNHPMWQPSLDSLRNVEQDEAGRLRAFRERFGRGWDLEGADEEGEALNASGQDGGKAGRAGKGKKGQGGGEAFGEESLMDLISGAAGGRTGGKK